MFFGFFSSKKTKFEEFTESWGVIKQTVSRKDKKEVLNNHLKQFHKTIKGARIAPDQFSSQIYDYIISNDIICRLVDFCTKYHEMHLILLDDVTMILYEAKWIPQLITSDKTLSAKLIQLISLLEKQMKDEKHRFVFKNSFAFLLNEVTRLLLNFPEMISSFKVNSDFIIFSNLLYLLQMDEMISSYEIRKYIRRSLIVSLSFDEIASSSYLENSNLVEILVNKLCNYYQLLPQSFELVNPELTIEIGNNIHKSISILTEFYIEFKDYVAFFNKITNTIRSHKLKAKIKYYLFNKFCIGNVQRRLLAKNAKVFRTNLQYIISFLHDVENSDLIDVVVNFLFGFNEQKTVMNYSDYLNKPLVDDLAGSSPFDGSSEEFAVYHHQADFDISGAYDHVNHSVSRIALKILKSLNNQYECLNIVSMELFDVLLEKRPYMMIHKFIKPYVDLCLRQTNEGESLRFYLGKKAYPSISTLLNMISLYEKYDTSNMKASIEYNMQKNYSYYINYDIDFYFYYIDAKHIMDDMDNKSVNENSQEGVDDANLLEGCLNFDMESNSNIDPHSEPNKRKGTETSNQAESNDANSNDINNTPSPRDEVQLDLLLFKPADEIKEEMLNINFMLMKNLHLKFCNYLNNTNHENIFLTNFLLTMISVPCLQFDSDLVECNALLLDDNSNSKYSLLTVIKYISQEIAKKVKRCITFDAFFKRCIREMNVETETGLQEKGKVSSFGKKTQTGKPGSKSIQDGVMTSFEPHLEEEYQRKRRDLVNYIVFFEFLKEFITTYSHKHRFENLVEDIYRLYSDFLDDYYYNDIKTKKLTG